MKSVILGLTLLAAASAPAAAACYDVLKNEPASLEGVLEQAMFAGPPNYENVQTGDMPEMVYLLQLDSAICIDGDMGANPDEKFLQVQLVADTPAVAALMHNLRGALVSVTLTKQTPSINGHHHRPLVAWVTDIGDAHLVEGGDDTEAYLAQYGTAATTVRAFYDALAAGEGGIAASLVLPERRKGPYSAEALGNYYGSLYQPLSLVSLKTIDETHFEARYIYIEAEHGACDGRANVTTKKVDGQNYVAGITALDGC